MFFLNPTYLWAMLGLIVPVAIHLWSKKEGRTIKVGSTKLLNETDSQKSRTIQLNEWFLLLLRMLLITILVIIIAAPRIKKKVDAIPITYIVEPALLNNERIRTIIDTLEKGPSLRLLQVDLPELEEEDLDKDNHHKLSYYWQLIQEMEALNTDSIVVFTNGFLSGLRGSRPKMSKKISWVAINPGNKVRKELKAIQKENGVNLLSLSSDQQHVTFKKEVIAVNNNGYTLNSTKDSLLFNVDEKQESLAITLEKPVNILLNYQESLANEATYINKTLNVISKFLKTPIEVQSAKNIDTVDIERFDMVVWLSTDSIPQTSAKVLAYQPDELASRIIKQGSTKRVFYITKSLTSENIIEEHFSEQLLRILDFHNDIKEEITKYDKRIVALEELLPVYIKPKVDTRNFSILDISKWFWGLLAILFMIERITAKLRNQ